MKIRRTTSLLALGLLLPACSSGEPSVEWTGAVRDSAGIRLVENSVEPLWTPERRWTLREEVRIGDFGGSPEYQFGELTPGIRLVDVDAEGNIYVLDQQASEVRVFDTAGIYLRTIGAPGSGPGELGRNTAGVFVSEGEVFVPDMSPGNFRLNRFSTAGEFLSSFAIDPVQGGVPIRWDLDPSGRIVAQKRVMAFPGTAIEAESEDRVVALDSTGAVLDTLMSMPTGETFTMADDQGPRIQLFSPEPIWTVATDGGLFFGLNHDFRITRRDAAGKVTAIFTKPFEAQPVTPRIREGFLGFLREAWANAGMPPPMVQQFERRVEFAENFPAFTSLFSGPRGSLWIQEVADLAELEEQGGFDGDMDPASLGSGGWQIFDVDGRFLGIMELPAGFTPTVSRGDRIYGWVTDEMGVPEVVVFLVEIPERPGI